MADRPLFRRRWFPWAVVGALVVAAAPLAGLVALGVAQEHSAAPPTCSGIGFGCELGPWSTAALMAALFYGPAVVALAAVLGLAELFGPRFQVVRSTLAVVGAVVVLGASLVFVVGVLA